LNVELRPDARESALFLSLAWLVEAGVWRSGRGHPLADLLLWARPELGRDEKSYREVSLALFGSVPVTPDGRPFALGDEGLVDPVRGSAFRPTWPKLPVSGGPLDHLIRVFSAARAEVAVDQEPGTGAEQSLRARVHLQLK
jgi:hypothetical protein